MLVRRYRRRWYGERVEEVKEMSTRLWDSRGVSGPKGRKMRLVNGIKISQRPHRTKKKRTVKCLDGCT